MKKKYYQPEWEILTVEEDVITASGEYCFDPDGYFNSGESAEDWEW